jgi:hypothetical protein
MIQGLTNGTVAALALDPIAPVTLYAGTEGGGVCDFQLVGRQLPGIIGYFETPEAGPVSGVTVIRGWAFSTRPESQITKVKVFVGDDSFEAPCCSERRDVQLAFPQFPSANTLQSGWGITMNWGVFQEVQVLDSRQIQVESQNTEGEHFFSDVRLVTLLKPGDFEFLDRFDLSEAGARIEDNDLVVDGVMVRNKASQQQRRINARFRWMIGTQTFGFVQTSIVEELAARRSALSMFRAAVPPRWRLLVSPTSAEGRSRIQSSFEDPAEHAIVSGIALIRGWAFPEDANATLQPIQLTIDGQTWGAAPCCSARADVAAVFPDAVHSLRSGWGSLINYNLLTEGGHRIGVQLSDSSGDGMTEDHTVTVVRPGGFEWLDQFELSTASVQIQNNTMVLTGVTARDAATQRSKRLAVRLGWVEGSQGLAIIAAQDL